MAKRILISVLDARVGSDICFDGNSYIQRLLVESTLSTVSKGHVTDALVVTITGGLVRITYGLLMGKCLSYNMNVVSEL